MSKVKVLYIVDGLMARGGTEAFIMNYYRRIDKEKIQIDFVQCGNGKGVYDDELKMNGSKLYYIPLKSKNPLKNIKELKQIFISNEYKIVHAMADSMNTWYLKIAKNCGIPVRIAHSHNTGGVSKHVIKLFTAWIMRLNLHKYATHYMACSKAAGEWLFGKNIKFDVIPNAIDFDKYKFNEGLRNELRGKYGINNKLVIGHVGQFRDQKNHTFLIDVFEKLHKKCPNSCLLLIGDGILRESMEEKIERYGLSSCVIIIKNSDKVNELLNVFDCFLFPSKFEGLSIALVEAQANGLICFTSENVSKESNILSRVDFISLSEDAEKWADCILKKITEFSNRNVSKEEFDLTKYSIDNESQKLENFYILI